MWTATSYTVHALLHEKITDIQAKATTMILIQLVPTRSQRRPFARRLDKCYNLISIIYILFCFSNWFDTLLLNFLFQHHILRITFNQLPQFLCFGVSFPALSLLHGQRAVHRWTNDCSWFLLAGNTFFLPNPWFDQRERYAFFVPCLSQNVLDSFSPHSSDRSWPWNHCSASSIPVPQSLCMGLHGMKTACK